MAHAPFNLQTERLFIFSVVVLASERQQWCDVPGKNAWLVVVNYQVWRPLLHIIQRSTGEFVYIVWWLIVWGLWQEQQWKCYVWQIRCGLCNSQLHETEHLSVPPSFATPYIYLPILYSIFFFCCIWCTNLILLVLIPQIIFVGGQRNFIFFWCTVWWVWKVKQGNASHPWMNNMKKSCIWMINLDSCSKFCALYLQLLCVFLLILPHLNM